MSVRLIFVLSVLLTLLPEVGIRLAATVLIFPFLSNLASAKVKRKVTLIAGHTIS